MWAPNETASPSRRWWPRGYDLSRGDLVVGATRKLSGGKRDVHNTKKLWRKGILETSRDQWCRWRDVCSRTTVGTWPRRCLSAAGLWTDAGDAGQSSSRVCKWSRQSQRSNGTCAPHAHVHSRTHTYADGDTMTAVWRGYICNGAFREINLWRQSIAHDPSASPCYVCSVSSRVLSSSRNTDDFHLFQEISGHSQERCPITVLPDKLSLSETHGQWLAALKKNGVRKYRRDSCNSTDDEWVYVWKADAVAWSMWMGKQKIFLIYNLRHAWKDNL